MGKGRGWRGGPGGGTCAGGHRGSAKDGVAFFSSLSPHKLRLECVWHVMY